MSYALGGALLIGFAYAVASLLIRELDRGQVDAWQRTKRYTESRLPPGYKPPATERVIAIRGGKRRAG